MAQTLSEGPVVPNAGGEEEISASGVAELRTLGATTNSALASIRVGAEAAAQAASAADSTSRARDAALEGLIAGMEGMTYVGAWDSGTTYRINDVVTHGGDSWARLTAGSAGEPGASPADWGLVARKGDGGGFGELSETDVDGLYETVEPTFRVPYDSGWLPIAPDGPAVDPSEPGAVEFRRVDDQVFCRVVGVAILPGMSNAWLLPNGIPVGYRLGAVGQVVDVPGGYANGATQANRAARHRISIQEDDIAYVGYIHNWDGVTVEAARADGSRRIYGTIPPWFTDDPLPA